MGCVGVCVCELGRKGRKEAHLSSQLSIAAAHNERRIQLIAIEALRVGHVLRYTAGACSSHVAPCLTFD